MLQNKSPYCDKLYDQAKNLKSKIEDKRNQLMDNLKKKSIPKILNVSKKIDRNANLFSERLYPYHKLAKSEDDEMQEENEIEYLHVATVRSNPLGISGEYDNEECKNNIDNIFHDVEEIKNLFGNKPHYVKFYRGIKNKKIQKYPFRPDTSSKKCSNSVEHAMKKSEEKKVAKSFHSSSPCKKINEFNYDTNKKITIEKNIFKDKLNEFKENEENKNNLSSNSSIKFKKRNISAQNSNFKKSKEKSNKKVLFADDENRNRKFYLGEEKEIISNNQIIDKQQFDIKDRIRNKSGNDKKIKDNPLRISEKLYTKGVNLLKKKEKLANEKLVAENEQLTKLTFTPNINKKKPTNNFTIKHINDEPINTSIIKNNSFTSGFSKSFDNMVAIKKDPKNIKNVNQIQNNFSKSKSPFNKITDKSNHYKNHSSNPNDNIEIINNLNEKIRKSNQWQFPNKHAKKIFDSAYIALINNFNSELVSKVNKDSPNEYSTNSSNNHSTLNKNQNITNNKSNQNSKSLNLKENELNLNVVNKEKFSVNSKSGDNYYTVIDKRLMNNTGIYDRCKKWKDNNNKELNKLRENFEKEQNKQCKFSPVIMKRVLKDFDNRFIIRESKYLETYIKRRRTSLEHLDDQKNYEQKIFGKSLDKFSKKITQPEEFHFSHSISRKSKGMLNGALNLHMPEKVKDLRKKFKTGNFFDQPILEFDENANNRNHSSLNKSSNNSLIDFFGKNPKMNKNLKSKNINIFEKNRKLINQNLKLNQKEKKLMDTISNKILINNFKNENKQSVLEDKNEKLNIEDSSKVKNNQSENNIVNTNPADEYNENVEKNIDEKLLNKNMNYHLNYHLDLV